MEHRLLLTLALLSCTAPAFAQPQPQPQPLSKPEPACLRQIDVYSFEPVAGNRALIVTDRRHNRYRVRFLGICNDLQFNMGLAFKTHGAGSLSCIGQGDSVIHRDPAGSPQCLIAGVDWQTPAMDKADAQAAAARHR
ncbi:MAG TPA: DUF6491 family protein [Rhizomicrobium sp.]|jgi:hypothetical protein|nr:DUF6491 family protein [Rhizomicrobium sp.]